MSHKYFYLSRPPSYGHQPPGFSNRDGGLPSRNWPTASGDDVWAFGWVEYPEALDFETCFKWDLMPDEPVELAHYIFWSFASRNADDAKYYEDDYVAAYLAGTLAENSHLYQWAKILADARGK